MLHSRILAAAICLVAIPLAGTPSWALDPNELAPPGVCAGDERELEVRAGANRSSAAADEATPAGLADGIAGPAQLHLSPIQVGAAGGSLGLPVPEAPAFAGPGACDDPGSGCAGGGKINEDPDPGTGCGFPGSPCP